MRLDRLDLKVMREEKTRWPKVDWILFINDVHTLSKICLNANFVLFLF